MQAWTKYTTWLGFEPTVSSSWNTGEAPKVFPAALPTRHAFPTAQPVVASAPDAYAGSQQPRQHPRSFSYQGRVHQTALLSGQGRQAGQSLLSG